MIKLLYLAQRIPFPPDKGDKITTFHVLKYLSQRADVYLAAFADDPMDMQYVGELEKYCRGVFIRPLDPRWAKVCALKSFARNEALTLGYFFDHKMRRWIDNTVSTQAIDQIFIYSSAMVQYVLDQKYSKTLRIGHYADIDSDKWRQYAQMHKGIKGKIYDREARLLFNFERSAANQIDHVSFVAENEAAQFREMCPELSSKIGVVENGTDTAYFDPGMTFPSPFRPESKAIVFTGAMDYFPNADAVAWFTREIFPHVLAQVPEAVFYVVGSKPGPEVRALALLPNVFVTGRVADVRPYLAHAQLAVAPLRAARGIQNKVLEAMSMGLPVACTRSVARPIHPELALLLDVADEAESFAATVARQLLAEPQPSARLHRRKLVEQHYSWVAKLGILDTLLSL